MFYDKESDFEDDLVAVLKRHGWTDGVLEYPTEQDLIDNWANILFDNNKGIDRLNGQRLTKGEMAQILEQIETLRTPLALNSFITADGGEMGRAQVVQAEAAGIAPDVRMNPILLKPTTDVGSQVIVNGKVLGNMRAMEYYRRKRELVPEVMRAYESLASEYDIIVIEGAGSPAEINLKQEDIVNMGLAKMVDAPVLLVGDIDRGGVFAQLYGTVALLEPDERARIRGLIINKFRGDVEILRPGLAMLEEKTQLPVLGVVPYLRVDIEDEDSLSERLDADKAVKPLTCVVSPYGQFFHTRYYTRRRRKKSSPRSIRGLDHLYFILIKPSACL